MKALKLIVFTLAVLVFPALHLSAQTVWKVDANSLAVTPGGLVWNDAFSDLQDAIDVAQRGDTIFVSEGTYYPDRGTNNRDSSFRMLDSVVFMGGFSTANNDTLLANRDFVNYVTILSGEIQQDADSTNNAYTIIDNSIGGQLDNAAVLNGFTIMHAYNNNTQAGETNGGGMINISVSPHIENCIFTRNTCAGSDGTTGGAAVYNFGSSSTYVNCEFSDNVADGDATALDNAYGAGIRNRQNSFSTYTNCRFYRNQSFGNSLAYGGAIMNEATSSSTLTSCIFQNNYCQIITAGGANTSNGACVFNRTACTSPMVNCLMTDNTIVSPLTLGTIAFGAAICNFNQAAYSIINTTIANNTAIGANARGGGIWSLSGTGVTIRNCIIYGNVAATSGASISSLSNPGGVNVGHSDVAGCGGSSAWVNACGTDNGGNIDADPDFTDDLNLDYTLAPCSPVFDAGLSAYVPGGILLDLNGDNRIQGGSVDMGAYELNPALGCGYTWDGSTDNDWGTASNWDLNAVPPDFSSIIIPNVTNQPVLDTIRSIGSLTIETNADLTLGSNRLKIYGDIDNLGTIINSASVIELLGTTSRSIDGSFTIDTLINSGTGPVTIASGTTSIRVELRPEAGTFNTGGNLVLLSDTNVTARIAEIKPGAAISGNVTVNQYVGGTINDWRTISAPISGRTLADWDDDFVTTGFPGSAFPFFGFVNVYTYDETVAGSYTNGYTAPTSLGNSLGTAQGFMVYMGGSQFTMDLTGTIHSGTYNISLDNSGVTADDGWNLIGNPYPSAVDFGALSRTNVDDSYFIYDPNTGNYAVWSEGLGFGTNGADGNIPQAQGFWVQTTGGSASIQFEEVDKVSTATKFFYKQARPPMMFALYDGNKRYDEIALRTDNKGLLKLDANDTRKLFNGDSTVPSISFTSADMEELAINTIPRYLDQETIIPITVHGKMGVTYQLTFENSDLLTEGNCMVLQNTHNNSTTIINDGSNYSFQLPKAGENNILQLLITPAPRIEMEVNGEVVEILPGSNSICEGDEVRLSGIGLTNSFFNWNDDVKDSELFIPEVGLHNYRVSEINNTLSCPLSSEIKLEVLPSPVPEISFENGVLKTGLFNSYQWFKDNNLLSGETKAELNYSGDGSYQVVVTGNGDCEGTSEVLEITGTGIAKETSLEGIRVYPNPGKNILTLSYGKMNGMNLSVTNVVGKLIRQQVINKSNSVQLDMSDVPSGIYFITLSSADENHVVKWIKE